ncbi:hypothetical protein LZ30DRAFT_136064 [Colletotrichum cereale]|nr:hypothetical protein LZ30DRAFT_136064 [Colletotrichum cereale]
MERGFHGLSFVFGPTHRKESCQNTGQVKVEEEVGTKCHELVGFVRHRMAPQVLVWGRSFATASTVSARLGVAELWQGGLLLASPGSPAVVGFEIHLCTLQKNLRSIGGFHTYLRLFRPLPCACVCMWHPISILCFLHIETLGTRDHTRENDTRNSVERLQGRLQEVSGLDWKWSSDQAHFRRLCLVFFMLWAQCITTNHRRSTNFASGEARKSTYYRQHFTPVSISPHAM